MAGSGSHLEAVNTDGDDARLQGRRTASRHRGCRLEQHARVRLTCATPTSRRVLPIGSGVCRPPPPKPESVPPGHTFTHTAPCRVQSRNEGVRWPTKVIILTPASLRILRPSGERRAHPRLRDSELRPEGREGKYGPQVNVIDLSGEACGLNPRRPSPYSSIVFEFSSQRARFSCVLCCAITK